MIPRWVDCTKIGIIGPGATGTVLAASMIRAGLSVRLLARTRKAAIRLRREGLRIGHKRIRRLEAVSHRGRDLGVCDAVLFCVKSYDTRTALRQARAMVGRNTPVLSIQNGLNHVGPLRRALGRGAVFGVAYFAARRDGDTVHHLGGDRIDLAATSENHPHVRRIRQFLIAAGWKSKTFRAETRLLWTKLVLNAALNPLGALARCPNGEILRRPGLRELLRLALGEGERLSLWHGVRPLVKRLDLAALRLCRETASNLNSMAQDLEAGRRTEVDAILGPLLRTAPDPSRDAPVLHGLHRFVKGLERELRIS